MQTIVVPHTLGMGWLTPGRIFFIGSPKEGNGCYSYNPNWSPITLDAHTMRRCAFPERVHKLLCISRVSKMDSQIKQCILTIQMCQGRILPLQIQIVQI